MAYTRAMEDQNDIERLRAEMQSRYDVDPDAVRIVRSPYRICPLGAHIDHQLGPVTAMAIDEAIHLAYVPSGSPEVRISSLVLDGEVHFSLGRIRPRRKGDWGNYARGAAVALAEHAYLEQGFVGVTAGRMSEGGVSSSSAVGIAYLLALEDVNGLETTAADNVELDRVIENGYLGLNNGILDQSAILLSRRDHLTLIDCRTAGHELIPRAASSPPFSILLAFSGLKGALVSMDYNRRVQECADAAAVLLEAADRPEQTRLLGNVTPEEYAALRTRLSDAPARRAEHFFTESERVRLGVAAWREGDIETVGRLMVESGRSSIENYECGSEPLIDLYHILAETEGVYGTRFSGAGFRGCCVALMDPQAAHGAVPRIRQAYAARHPDLAQDAPVFICGTDDGARIL